MGLHSLRLGSFPKPTEGKAAIQDVKVCYNVVLRITFVYLVFVLVF
jgi:hypothetical protein